MRQRAVIATLASAPMNPAQHAPVIEQAEALPSVLRGEMMFTCKFGSDAAAALLELANAYTARDIRLARELYLEALSTVLFAGRLAGARGVLEVAVAGAAAPRPEEPARPTDVMLDGLTAVVLDGAGGVRLVRRAVDAFCRMDETRHHDGTRWLWLACHAAIIAWDHRAWQLLPARQVALAREAGDERALAVALQSHAAALVWTGDFATARRLIAEADSVAAATATMMFPYAALPLAAWRGDQAEARRLMRAGRHYAVARGEGMGLASIELATAVLCNGLGRYEDAFAAAREGSEHPQELWANFLLPELIEAATRCGQANVANRALHMLTESAHAADTDWALGALACSRALASGDAAAEGLYREGVERLDRTNLRPAAARARLVYGEWLRRERRPLDARAQLRPSYEMFAAIGMEAFRERARLELEATGERVRERHSPADSSGLTPREVQVAALAARGATNAEIGAQLYISSNTVAYHLRKVFTKLGVTARRQLGRALKDESGD